LVKDCRVENTENFVIGDPISFIVQPLELGHLEKIKLIKALTENTGLVAPRDGK